MLNERVMQKEWPKRKTDRTRASPRPRSCKRNACNVGEVVTRIISRHRLVGQEYQVGVQHRSIQRRRVISNKYMLWHNKRMQATPGAASCIHRTRQNGMIELRVPSAQRTVVIDHNQACVYCRRAIHYTIAQSTSNITRKHHHKYDITLAILSRIPNFY